MATVIVAVWQAGKNGQGSSAPVLRGAPRAVQTITTTTDNAVSTLRANTGEVFMVSVSGNAVAVAYANGANPNAETTPHAVIGDGSSLPVEASADDFRVAVADIA
jgi:hypothetical protein